MGENSYLKDKFRADVFKEIEEYIEHVYGDDYHGNDKLIVNPFDMSVSHGTRSVDEIEKKHDYFDTFGLIKRDGEFTFTPDPVGIECVVLHYFPDTRVSLFVDNAIKAINKFINTHGYSQEAEFSFMLRKIEFYTYCPSEMETIEAEDYDEELDIEGIDWECRKMRPFLYNSKSKGFVVREDKLVRLAAELLLDHDDFMSEEKI